MTVRESILEIIRDKFSNSFLRFGTVDSVNVSAKTCVVIPLDNTDVKLLSVKLQATAGDGLFFKPTIGSVVGVVPNADAEYSVVFYSSLDAIELLGSSNGGLVKIADLVSKINNLENKVNAIITWGATVSPPLATPPLTVTTQASIENTKIKHG